MSLDQKGFVDGLVSKLKTTKFCSEDYLEALEYVYTQGDSLKQQVFDKIRLPLSYGHVFHDKNGEPVYTIADHLPRLSNPRRDPVKTTYECSEPYGSGPFQGYPDRLRTKLGGSFTRSR